MNLADSRNWDKVKRSSITHVYTAERGLLEPALGLYGLGSPAMLISKDKETDASYSTITHSIHLKPYHSNQQLNKVSSFLHRCIDYTA